MKWGNLRTNNMGVPRLCRGGNRSLTYTVVVLRETCDGLRHEHRLSAQGVVRSVVELRGRGVGAALLRELARRVQVAAVEAL